MRKLESAITTIKRGVYNDKIYILHLLKSIRSILNEIFFNFWWHAFKV